MKYIPLDMFFARPLAVYIFPVPCITTPPTPRAKHIQFSAQQLIALLVLLSFAGLRHLELVRGSWLFGRFVGGCRVGGGEGGLGPGHALERVSNDCAR